MKIFTSAYGDDETSLQSANVYVDATLCGVLPATAISGAWYTVKCEGQSGIQGAVVRIEGALTNSNLSLCGVKVFGTQNQVDIGTVPPHAIDLVSDSYGNLHVLTSRDKLYRHRATENGWAILDEDSVGFSVGPQEDTFRIGRDLTDMTSATYSNSNLWFYKADKTW